MAGPANSGRPKYGDDKTKVVIHLNSHVDLPYDWEVSTEFINLSEVDIEMCYRRYAHSVGHLMQNL